MDLKAVTKTVTYISPEPGQGSQQFSLPVSGLPPQHPVRNTSDVTILSTTHGQQRRVERNITKRDLQAAVLHGKKQKAGIDPVTKQPRWKYTHGDIVYITDETSKIEVTSYVQPAPLEKALTTQEMLQKHAVDRALIALDPTCITSHTIFVVDQSASMKISDVQGYKNRLHAVYSMMGANIPTTHRKYDRDVASLIEMREESMVVFECEPMDWILYNKMVDLANTVRPGGHGNYLPALDATERLLDKLSHGGCALLIAFLSDGMPSDRILKGMGKGMSSDERQSKLMKDRVLNIASKIGRRLNFGTIAIAESDMSASMVSRKRKMGECFAEVLGDASGANQASRKEFVVLQGMAEAANDFSIGSFQTAKNMLGKAIVSLTTSLTSTKLELTVAGPGSAQRKVRQVEREMFEVSSTGDIKVIWQFNDIWLYESTDNARLFRRGGEECERYVYNIQTDDWMKVGFLSFGANSIAVRKKSIGEGSERMVFAMTELNYSAKNYAPVGPPLIAKEGRFVEDLSGKQFKYHKDFCRSQFQCSQYAEAFNTQLATTLSPVEVATTPRISFLTCSVYLVREQNGSGREILVEKRLDMDKYTKFNNNAGFVLDEKDFASESKRPSKIRSKVMFTGIDEESEALPVPGVPDVGVAPLPGLQGGAGSSQPAVLLLLRQRAAAQALRVCGYPLPKVLSRPTFGAQASVVGGFPLPKVPTELPNFRPKIQPSDIPQAFSHFTFDSSERMRLVCDLQGVYSPANGGKPPLFELTDPVILHNKESDGKSGKRMGRGGGKRIAQFFNSHKCNEIQFTCKEPMAY